ncbi:hypothetical protein AGMMS49545_10370 [Betaproteobacteria bacterium]|nr:hypothetical protein AGMMS49545_10370 [Betaproteobacteria bacterium]GHU44353.1 hypothetical protein AGMMS50289_12450 [Betaproteobacteria bacterium]
MDFLFEESLLRLKKQLGVKEDKEVAEFLGLSATAFNKRKQRGSFPETELYALAAKRPELKLDVGLVLYGERLTEYQRRAVQVVAAHPPASNPDLAADFASAYLESSARRQVRIDEIKDTVSFMSDSTLDLALQILKALYQVEQNAKINAKSWHRARPEDF